MKIYDDELSRLEGQAAIGYLVDQKREIDEAESG